MILMQRTGTKNVHNWDYKISRKINADPPNIKRSSWNVQTQKTTKHTRLQNSTKNRRPTKINSTNQMHRSLATD